MEATVIPSAIVLQVLNQKNYDHWSVRVKTYLLGEDLWDVVEATAEPPKREHGEAKFVAWKKKNAKALHAIQISCGPETFTLIRDESVAKIAWDNLAAKFNPGLPNNQGHDSNADDFRQYDFLYNVVKNGDWDAANKFLIEHPDAKGARITYLGKTALHTAADNGHTDIVIKLVDMMQEKDLEIKGYDGKTALVIATNKGNTQMVECMVTKNKNIVRIADASKRLPVVLAYRNSNWDLAWYLYKATPLEDLKPENGPNGATLVSQCFYAKKFDIAWDLIQRYPRLAITKDLFEVSPIYALASVPSVFRSGKRLNFWQKRIYDSIHIRPTPVIHDVNDSSVNVPHSENDQGIQLQLAPPCSVVCLLQVLARNLHKLLGIKHLYEMKLIHVRSSEFLDRMCEEIQHLNSKEMEDGFVHAAVFRAVEQGIPEFIIRTCKANRELVKISNEKGRSIFHYAIECRQEKVYNLIHGLDIKNSIKALTDTSNNNMLHMAALLSPFAQLNRIPGAALQMQRELQWFKEVEVVVAPKAAELMNWTDYMTPRDLFTENHKKLLKEGEKWMKETATSFTVVGALIVTLMFATAFTIPGGYRGDTGLPIFLNEKLFITFIISDAISLFSATTSSLMFLEILTSRYAEDDFLKYLPTKMVIGLFTLFFSILTMMLAFCSALLLMLQEKPWTVIPIVLLSCIPVTLFAVMKIPLLFQILISTYGAGIFEKNFKSWL